MTTFSLGLDIGSSSVKASLLDCESGVAVAHATSPSEAELEISSPQSGFAEQDPDIWWHHVKNCLAELGKHADLSQVVTVGISYQMHGLVTVDSELKVIRPAIIWCDSRAAEIGRSAFHQMGEEYCLSRFLNSPGNFTASKLKWVKENEPDLFTKVYAAMLPGDFIAMKLTGVPTTTASGLSEGVLWNFKEDRLASEVLDHYGISSALIPEIVPTFAPQGEVTEFASKECGLPPGIPVAYRAGDQPNNAFSLFVLNPGDFAASAGTSGVVYGVGECAKFDLKSRVNTFLHVNHTRDLPRLGTLLCINGTGSLNRWLRSLFNQFHSGAVPYSQMNELASTVNPGAQNLQFFPYGNGAERSLSDRNLGASLLGLDFNVHKASHLIRAAQEGIAFAFRYGTDIMAQMGVEPKVIRACDTSMFQSRLFCQIFSNVMCCKLELYQTDGAEGAARGAGVGAGVFDDFDQAFQGMKRVLCFEPQQSSVELYEDLYRSWREKLALLIEGETDVTTNNV